MKELKLKKKIFEEKIPLESIMLKNLTKWAADGKDDFVLPRGKHWKGKIHAVYRKIYLRRKKVYRAMRLLEKQQRAMELLEKQQKEES